MSLPSWKALSWEAPLTAAISCSEATCTWRRPEGSAKAEAAIDSHEPATEGAVAARSCRARPRSESTLMTWSST